MSEKKERKLEELSVDEAIYRFVLDRAAERHKDRVRLRDMIDRDGAFLRDAVIVPGAIEHMKREYFETLQKEGVPRAAEQAEDFETMLVEIRRRVEEGTLRIGRKPNSKAGTGAGKGEKPQDEQSEQRSASSRRDGRGGGDSGGASDGQNGIEQDILPQTPSDQNLHIDPVRGTEDGEPAEEERAEAVQRGGGEAARPSDEATSHGLRADLADLVSAEDQADDVDEAPEGSANGQPAWRQRSELNRHGNGDGL